MPAANTHTRTRPVGGSALQDGRCAIPSKPDALGHAELGIRHLSLARVAAQLPGHLTDLKDALGCGGLAEAEIGDTVYAEVGADATPASLLVENGDYETEEMEVSFLAVDSTNVHDTGNPQTWRGSARPGLRRRRPSRWVLGDRSERLGYRRGQFDNSRSRGLGRRFQRRRKLV